MKMKGSAVQIRVAVLAASDGPEALRLLSQNREKIVCVVLDLTMPQMSGDEVFRELRRIAPDVRVILTSGYSEGKLMDRFAGQQIFGYVEKPDPIDAALTRFGELVDELDRLV